MLDSITGHIHIKNILICKRNEFFSKYGHLIRKTVLENINKVMDCGCNLGYLWYKCKYGHEHFTFFTCKSRFCNSCSKPLSDLRIRKLYSRIPRGISYHHLTFTIPKQLRPFFNRHRSALSVLPYTANYVISEICNKKLHGLPGCIAVIHTFGSLLIRNPHVHVLLTHGVFSFKDNIFTKSKFFVPIHLIRAIRTKRLIDNLENRVTNNLHGKNLDYERTFLRGIGNLKNSDGDKTYYYVSISKEVFSFEFILGYIGRYLKRPVISESRITSFDGENISFIYKDKRDSLLKTQTLPALHFIGRLIQHIPEKNFHMIYYYGIFFNRCKSKYISHINQLYPSRRCMIQPPKTHAARMKAWLNINPLICSRCGSDLYKYCMIVPGYKPIYYDPPDS